MVADNAGVELAVEQHLRQILAGRGALDVRRVLELGEMRILEGDPFHLLFVDAVLLA